MFEKESNGMSEEERTDFVIALKRKMCLENGKVTDADVYFQGVKDGYNKANEWHYPSKGEYPKELEGVVCYCKGYCGVSYGITARLVIGFDGVYRWWTLAGEGKSEQLTDVIAWKEIVLPELPKEE